MKFFVSNKDFPQLIQFIEIKAKDLFKKEPQPCFNDDNEEGTSFKINWKIKFMLFNISKRSKLFSILQKTSKIQN